MSESEQDIQRSIVAYLESRGKLVWRCAVGALRVAGGRRVKNKIAGFPDLAFIVGDGRLGTVEVKRPGEKLDPLQKIWKDKLEAKGVLCITATSVSDVEDALGQAAGGAA